MIDRERHIQLCTSFLLIVLCTAHSLVYGIFHATVEINLSILMNVIQ